MNNGKKAKRLLRMSEVLKILPYSETKIYELIREGKLIAACPNGPGKKPVFILEESLEKFINEIIVDPKDWLDIEIAQKQWAKKQAKRRRIISCGIK